MNSGTGPLTASGLTGCEGATLPPLAAAPKKRQVGSGGHGPADTGLGDQGGARPGPSAAHLAEGGRPGVELRAGPPAPSPCHTLTAPGRGLVVRGRHRPTPHCHGTALLHQCGHGTGWEGAGPSAPRPPATIQEEVHEAAALAGGRGSAAGRWLFLHSESCLRRLPSHQPATTPPSDSQADGTNARRAHLQPRLLEGLLGPTVPSAQRSAPLSCAQAPRPPPFP